MPMQMGLIAGAQATAYHMRCMFCQVAPESASHALLQLPWQYVLCRAPCTSPLTARGAHAARER